MNFRSWEQRNEPGGQRSNFDGFWSLSPQNADMIKAIFGRHYAHGNTTTVIVAAAAAATAAATAGVTLVCTGTSRVLLSNSSSTKSRFLFQVEFFIKLEFYQNSTYI
jgi:hypothetical protein